MVNSDTGLVEEDVPTVLEYIFTTYGKVTAEEVNKKEHECLNISSNLADSMITIYRPIKQLQKKANEARIPYYEAQLLEFGLSLIHRARDFEKALREWNSKNPGDKIWSNFKPLFRASQVELKEIRGPTMHQAGYHHANMLAQQSRTDLTNQLTKILTMVQKLLPVPEQADYQPELVIQAAANAVINTVQQQMLEILQAMQGMQGT